MWTDNETDRDFLNFSGVADTIAEVIVQADGKPVSIGVSGSWGVGKSSLIQLTRQALIERPHQATREYVFINFNAWLYQGYDDARAALMNVIVDKLQEESKAREKASDKIVGLLKRVDWLRTAKVATGSIVSLAMGLPPIGLIGEAYGIVKQLIGGEINEATITAAQAKAGEIKTTAESLIKEKQVDSPPREIQALRDDLEDTLQELGICIVVLIDDLDRCLPETTISTLEAIRLFLFLKNTAFVIAADDEMIKHAVKKHFEGVEDSTLITNYFDKLIQVPIKVPPLGTQEVRAYLMMLFIDNSTISEEQKEKIRKGVIEQLQKTWQGQKVDKTFIQSIESNLPSELIGKLDTAHRLAPLMASASGIMGNPRLIKRFLNALSIRMSISNKQGVGVDETVLAKLLLFERLATPTAYVALTTNVSNDPEGKPTILSEWETDLAQGKEVTLPPDWDNPFITEWLKLSPTLSEKDLRGAFYVSREFAPISTMQDRLSSEGAELLTALLSSPAVADAFAGRLATLPRLDLMMIMDAILEKMKPEQSWGVPEMLQAAIELAEVDAIQATRLVAFLKDRPRVQIQPSIIPKLSGYSWAKELFDFWSQDSLVSQPVKAAIKENIKQEKK